jgi:hypothetical protein
MAERAVEMDGIPKCLKKDKLLGCCERNGHLGIHPVVLKKVQVCMRDGPAIIHAPNHWSQLCQRSSGLHTGNGAMSPTIIGRHSSVHISPLFAEYSFMQFCASYAKTYF